MNGKLIPLLIPVFLIALSGCTEKEADPDPVYEIFVNSVEIRDETPGPVSVDAPSGKEYLYVEIEMYFFESTKDQEVWPGDFDVVSFNETMFPGKYFMDDGGDAFSAFQLTPDIGETFWVVFEIVENDVIDEFRYGDHGLLDEPVIVPL